MNAKYLGNTFWWTSDIDGSRSLCNGVKKSYPLQLKEMVNDWDLLRDAGRAALGSASRQKNAKDFGRRGLSAAAGETGLPHAWLQAIAFHRISSKTLMQLATTFSMAGACGAIH